MIFVFGSNLAGRHGKGAALHARKHYGAEYGVGEGRTGMSYALPTKDEKLNTLPFRAIEGYYDNFLKYATDCRDEGFLLTPFGTGLAGYPLDIVAEMVANKTPPENVFLHNSWLKGYKQ